MVIDPDDPDSVSAGSFFTNPILDPAHFEQLEERVARDLGPTRGCRAFRAGRTGEDLGRVARRARRLRPRLRRAGADHGLHEALAGADEPRRRGLPRSSSRSRTRSSVGVRERFGVELTPEPVFVGDGWTMGRASES